MFAATAAPARAIGRRDLGSLAPGMPADVVLWDDDLVVSYVWQGGSLTEPA
ncbi:N-acetylglucosamine-6-phosphate deacetylase [Yonghaparkia alkaliphila]|uniref:N-acetylglucosamine-6-phosphate deacetylase n=1 Tax=Microcella alkalica TaxID=355930 RepID=A0A839EC82_9MICO|nr:N-acetylglucosamine-6-phosphate deacetylase [Microcella alkalica]